VTELRNQVDKVELGFKAFDLHELLLHLVARRLDIYDRHGLSVGLRDTTFLPDQELPRTLFSAACGSALVSSLKGGNRQIVLVATDRPLFWLYAREGVTTLSGIQGETVAVYPSIAPPFQFLRIILREAGLDPERDVRLEPARDDRARLGLLELGEVAGAVISSAVPPHRMKQLGFSPLLFFGDHLRIPTTGLSVSRDLIQEQPGVVGKMAAAHRESLNALQERSREVIPILGDLLHESGQTAALTYELVRPYFTRTGKTRPEDYRDSLRLLAAELGEASSISAQEVFDFSFLNESE
jgi:ABC-type nitrate/sulfonate/bicarbonate transport system substrate-binding protein